MKIKLYDNSKYTLTISLEWIIYTIIGIIIAVQLHHISKAMYQEIDIAESIYELEESPLSKIMSMNPEEGFMPAMEYLCIPHPEIVYAQARLESGNFTNPKAIEYNNYLGLMSNGKLIRFLHWYDCLEFYRNVISSQYTDTTQDYYRFLMELPYATDSSYIYKLKQLVK